MQKDLASNASQSRPERAIHFDGIVPRRPVVINCGRGSRCTRCVAVPDSRGV